MRSFLLLLLLGFGSAGFWYTAPAWAQETSEARTLAALQAGQQDFIARFSGAVPHEGADEDAITLPARATREQRARAADLLMATLTDRGLPAARHRYRHPNMHGLLDLFMPPFRGQNFISHIPATTPSDLYIVIGAHYDSVSSSPGADDNASGVAAALSIGEALMELERRNAHFLIVLFDHEEDGSAGSKAYVRKLQNENIQIHSMHNIDMVGWDGDGDRTIEADLPTDEMARLYREAAEARRVAITRVTYNSADHLSFRNAGIDAVCVSEEYGSGDSTPHYHKPTDMIDAVNFDFLASTTLVLIDVMTVLASTP